MASGQRARLVRVRQAFQGKYVAVDTEPLVGWSRRDRPGIFTTDRGDFRATTPPTAHSRLLQTRRIAAHIVVDMVMREVDRFSEIGFPQLGHSSTLRRWRINGLACPDMRARLRNPMACLPLENVLVRGTL